MMKPLNTMKPNFAGAESEQLIATGILNFEGEAGHKIVDMCVHDLLKNFNGKEWVSFQFIFRISHYLHRCFIIFKANNGPGVITRVLKNICKTSNISQMIETCGDIFQVLSTDICSAIYWEDFEKFFNEKDMIETMSRLNNSLIAHVWNKNSHKIPLPKDANVAYLKLAEEHCPRVFVASESF